jgi:FAD binding domain-containing protein
MMRNWNGCAVWTPAVTVTPNGIAELQDIVKDQSRYPSPVRPVGSRHSLNECATTEGTAVDMNHFRAIGEPAKGLITVGAGVRMIEIGHKLKDHGLQLEVLPEIGNATAGSVACCGTKDSSIGPKGLGQVSSCVAVLRMIDADGNDLTIDDTSQPSLAEVRCSYGLLGIIHEVTFRTRPLQTLEFSYRTFDLDPLPTLDQILGAPEGGFLAILLPYRRKLLVERRRPLAKYVEPALHERIRRWIRDWIWENGGSILATILPYNWWFHIIDEIFPIPFTLLGSFRAARADTMIDFKEARWHYFDFTFWAIPVSQWSKIIPAYMSWSQDYLRRTGFRPGLSPEMYFIRCDQHSPLSFSFKEDIFTLDMVDCRPNDPSWHEMNRAFNQLIAGFGGRPLLNQTKQFSRKLVPKLDADWQTAWKDLATKARARPRFINDYFDALLP